MMPRLTVLCAFLLLTALMSGESYAQFGSFERITYQGELRDNGAPVNGTADLTFVFFAVPQGGSALSSARLAVPVDDGRFTARLPATSVPLEQPLWLEVRVNDPASGSFEVLTPRQEVTAVPRALIADSVAPGVLLWERSSFRGDSSPNIFYDNGFVGIGTQTPGYLLDVRGPSATLRAEATDGSAAFLRLQRAGFGESYIALGNDDDLFFSINAIDRMVLSSDGKLGLGTQTPDAGVDVVRGGSLDVGVRVTNNAGGVGFDAALGFAGIGVRSTVSTGTAVHAISQSGGIGVHAVAPTTGLAIQADGNVTVNGTLAKSAGSFRIDHPLDPKNRYLSHSFVESPDMMNIYNGNVMTDETGFAEVEMPEWFDALNRDFRYQLTVIGSFARATIGEKLDGHRFVILTDEPNVEVSWQVTGIRDDPYARAHPIVIETDKSEDQRGRYQFGDYARYADDPSR